MIWVGVIIVTYIIGLAIAFLAIGVNDETNVWKYSYSYGFAMALLVMLVYANIC